MEALYFYTHSELGIYHIFYLRVYGGQRMDCKFYPLVKGSQKQPTTEIWHNTVWNIQGVAVRLSAQRLNRLNPVWLLSVLVYSSGNWDTVHIPAAANGSPGGFGLCTCLLGSLVWLLYYVLQFICMEPKPACGYLHQRGNHLLMGAMLVLSADSSLICLYSFVQWASLFVESLP